MKNRWLLLKPYALALYQIIINSSFTLALLFLGWYTLTQLPQAQDVLKEYMSQKGWTWPLTFLYGAVFFWSYVSQACLNITLFNAENIDKNAVAERVAKWFPFILAQLPFVALLQNLWGYSLLVLSLLTVLYLVFFISNLIALIKWDEKWISQLWNLSGSIPDDFRKLWSNVQYRIFLEAIGGVSIVCIFFFVILPVDSGIAVLIGTPAILVAGVCVLTTFFSLLLFMSSPARRPIVTFFFVYLWVVSYWNDNKEIRKGEGQANRSIVADSNDFRAWALDRKAKGYAPKDTLPVVLIATEGGGIRAAAFTMLSLLKLNTVIPEFDAHLYAVSGVSGGGVGATFYTAYRHDQQLSPFHMKDSLLRAFCHQDFLSDVLGGFLFSDAINSLSPFPITGLDRNRKLEDAWAAGYKRVFDSPTLDSDFSKLWKPSANVPRNFDLPALILNGTLAETGQRIITSNLDLKNKKGSFEDIVFTFDQRPNDIPVKTAALLCARFPLITSGGLLKNAKDERVGHITDGGYFENTGMETLTQLLNSVSEDVNKLRTATDSTHLVINFHIIFLQNSQPSDTENEIDSTKNIPTNELLLKPIKRAAFTDYSTIVKSFFNPWSRGTQTRTILFKSVFEKRKDLNASFYHIQLKRVDSQKEIGGRRDYPLGWFLSNQLVQQMSDDLDKDPSYQKNFLLLRQRLNRIPHSL
ncbi:patatin-like phospholipase family protein [Runella sp.]|uniref:patatin-like phospholipase family protein n=1 Tax=Runella sp. TaxID=1960881 RepID=UPI003D10871F